MKRVPLFQRHSADGISSRRRLPRIGVAIGAALTIALSAVPIAGQARGTQAPAQAWQRSPVVMKFADSEEPVSIDPAIANVDFDFNVTRNTYEGLTTYSTKTLHLQPALATSWKGSGRSWTFNLRRGVRFTDGTLFTARDVTASINRTLGINQGE